MESLSELKAVDRAEGRLAGAEATASRQCGVRRPVDRGPQAESGGSLAGEDGDQSAVPRCGPGAGRVPRGLPALLVDRNRRTVSSQGNQGRVSTEHQTTGRKILLTGLASCQDHTQTPCGACSAAGGAGSEGRTSQGGAVPGSPGPGPRCHDGDGSMTMLGRCWGVVGTGSRWLPVQPALGARSGNPLPRGDAMALP